jgi:hypothetical protein
MELIQIKINRHTDIVSGIKIFENDQIFIIIHNPMDFVLDGISVINKKFIKQIKIVKDTAIKSIILKEKVNQFRFLESSIDFFPAIKNGIEYLYNKDKLVELYFESSSYTKIGKITKVNTSTFYINLLSTKGDFLGEQQFRYDKVRTISVENDYLNGLEYYIKLKNF